MNMGEGIPCTLASVEGVDYEKVPDTVSSENVKIRDGFEEDIAHCVNNLKEGHARMAELVESKSISKSKAREMLAVMTKALQDVERNAPFMVSSFQESAEKVVSNAKAEIEAFTTMRLRSAGMEHLKLQAEGKLPQLQEENE